MQQAIVDATFAPDGTSNSWLLAGEPDSDLTAAHSISRSARVSWSRCRVGTAPTCWAIAGRGRVDAGRILVDDDPITSHGEALAAGVALIPQGGALASLLTAYENVLLPLSGGGPAPGKWALATATRRRSLSQGPTFPGRGGRPGTRRRAAPAAGGPGDHRPRPGNRALVIGLLRDLATSGAGVLLATDDAAVLDACDRVATL